MLLSLLTAALLAAAPSRPLPPHQAAPPAAPPVVQAPTQWEYTMVETVGINAGATQEFLGLRSEPTAKTLNVYGAEGWELVSALRERDGERVYFVFKRAIPAAR